jgi:high-affinity Fe2+/Pb2+ permease
MYGSAIFFSALAVNRETAMSSLLAAFLWLITALFTFILGPSSVGIAFGWSMATLSFVFMGVFLWRLIVATLDSQHQKKSVRFETWGPF